MNTILTGDCLEMLRKLKPASVQMCVTSPPYWGLRDYGIPGRVWGGDPHHSHEWGAVTRHRNAGGPQVPQTKWKACTSVASAQRDTASGMCACGAWCGVLGLEPTIDLYVSHIVEVFREVRRVLKDDGTLWLNLGDSYATGGGRVGTAPGGGKQGRKLRGLMTTPNRMPQPGLKPKDLCMIPARVALALQADGWWLRSDIIWHKPNPMPESVTDRPTKSHEYLFLLSKSERYYYNADAIKEPCKADTAARYERGRSDNHKWADGGPGRQTIATNGPGSLFRKSGNTAKLWGTNETSNRRDGIGLVEMQRGIPWEDTGKRRNRRTVWTLPTKPFKGAHFATFPPKLVEPCILAGSRPGDAVLDPFAGAFTVPLVAQEHGRSFVACELNPSYVAMGKERLKTTAKTLKQSA